MHKLISTVFLLCGFSAGAYAGNNTHTIIDGGMVHLRDGLVEAGCTLSTNSENDVIDMGEFRTNQFKGTGSYSGNIPFKLIITNCSTAVSSKVGLSVFGYINEQEPQIIKLEDSDETAKGVGIAILDSDGDIIIPDNMPSKWINFHEGENTLHFNARYRATDMQVTGGKANASVWFHLTYK